MRYVTSPSDEEVNELFNQATVFVQTSTHEGFCLPPLEAMATGGAVVCTDAHGNRDFCARRRELPDARADDASGRRRAARGCSPTRRCARGWARAGVETARATTRGSGGSTRSRPSSTEDRRAAARSRRSTDVVPAATAARRPVQDAPSDHDAEFARIAALPGLPPRPDAVPVRRAKRRARGARGRARAAAHAERVRRCIAACASCCTIRPSTSLARPPGSSASPSYMRATAGTERVGAAAARHRHGYWYVQARSITSCSRRCRSARARARSTSARTPAGRPTTSPSAACRRSRWTSRTVELQGLYTADYFIEDGTSYFERVLGSMDAMPLASEQPRLRVLLRGPPPQRHATACAARSKRSSACCKPGGRLLMVNETLKTSTTRTACTPRPSSSSRATSTRTGRRAIAGRRPRRLLTEVDRAALPLVLRRCRAHLRPDAPALGRWPDGAASRCARSACASGVPGWLDHVRGGVSMNMIATKPRALRRPARARWRAQRLRAARSRRCAGRRPPSRLAPRGCRARPSRRHATSAGPVELAR